MLDDLQPRPGLETELAEQIGETCWSIRRTQHMRRGLALKHIQIGSEAERTKALEHAEEAYERLEPFERLQAVLARRAEPPTTEEVEEFAQSCEDDDSDKMAEFIQLLTSLTEPMEEPERKAALRQARASLRQIMEPYETAAWHLSRQVEKVDSAENRAAMMAPHNQTAVLMQRLEDSHLRRLCQLTHTLAKIRQGALQTRKNNEQSRNVHENKENYDKMPVTNSDIK